MRNPLTPCASLPVEDAVSEDILLRPHITFSLDSTKAKFGPVVITISDRTLYQWILLLEHISLFSII